MILQKLYKYAEEKKLVEDPDFEKVGIHWLINVGDNGEFLGLIALGDVLDNKKSKGKPKFVPKRKVRSSGVAPYFLVDKPQYIFPEWTDGKKKKTYHQKFTELIQVAFEKTQDKELKAISDFLNNEDELAKALSKLEEYKIDFSNHEISFCYEQPVNELIENINAKNFWKEFSSSQAESQNEVLCLITGKKGSSVINHDVLKGVPGAITSGSPLVSFNTDAYESYGLIGNENATISKLASEQAMAGLRNLLSSKTKKSITIKKGKTEKTEEKEVLTNRINLSDDTCAVYWLREENKESDSYLDFFESGYNASSEEAKALFDSVFAGKSPLPLDSNEFYLLVLKGNQGRIAISSYLEENLPNIQENIIQWFKDLDLGEESEKRVSKGRKELLRALIRAGDDKKIPSRLSLELFLSVIRGSPLPRSILVMALERVEQEPSSWRVKPEDLSKWLKVHNRRMSLLKAYLIRLNRKIYEDFLQKKEKEKQMNLQTIDSEEKKKAYIAYQLGKLYWVLTDTQKVAILGTKKKQLENQDSKSSSEKQHHGSATYFKIASSKPSKIFHQLLSDHRTIYLPKLQRDHIGIATNKEKQILEILGELGSDFEANMNNPFPDTLSQEDRALFVLGFYKQQQKDKEEALKNQKNNQQKEGN